MLKYRGPALIKSGFIGAVLIGLVITVGLQPERLISLATALRYRAMFVDGGGLTVGNDVTVSGVKVGTVTDISLDHGDALVSFAIDGKVRLGSDSTAHIRTGSVLGQRILTLESHGHQRMHALTVIPTSRTSSPYSLSDAVGNLTTDAAGTSTESLNQSLDTLSRTIDRIAPQLGTTFENLTRLSQTINGRNEALDELLHSTKDVTGVLSQRSQQLNALILNTNDLLAVLVRRREAIVDLLSNTSAVSRELSGLVHENEHDLEPALEKLNRVTAMLEKSRDNLDKFVPLFAKNELMAGEVVSSGFYYTAYAANLVPSQILQPFLDYYFGFRRGANMGQPPDNAGPRALFPWPHNAIPQRPQGQR